VVDDEALIGHQMTSQCQVLLLQMHPYGVGFLLWLWLLVSLKLYLHNILNIVFELLLWYLQSGC
jgi:hypothetical protein